MIGSSAFFIRVAFLLGGLFFVSLPIFIYFHSKIKSIFIFLGFGLIVLFLSVFSLVKDLKNHAFLSSLSSRKIECIWIEKEVICEANKIEKIVNGLRNKRWFAPNHGGWAKQVPLGILFKSGEKRVLLAARYLRREGVVIKFCRIKFNGDYFGCCDVIQSVLSVSLLFVL